jgi:hypothetical protein
MSIICRRAYDTTIPWNMPPVLLPFDAPCDFPNLKIPSEDHVCKRIEAIIEGEEGVFFGIVRKSTGLPDGYGLFYAGGWVHCGRVKVRKPANEQANNLTSISDLFKSSVKELQVEVKDCVFQEGRKVSVNREARLLKLTNKKCLADGSVLNDIELFSK